MKIYFAGSIRGGREDQKLYFDIIQYLQSFGKVLTEHVGQEYLNEAGEENINDNDIYDRDIKWLTESNIVIAEVTNPSLGVGYEISKALELNKKIICLYRNNQNKSLSAMINGNKALTIINYEYLEDLKKEIKICFNLIKY